MTVDSANFGVRVLQHGDLVAKLDGITALSTGNGDASIAVGLVGSLTSYDGRGLVAVSENGRVYLSATGNVTSKLDAIQARSHSGSSE